MLIEYAQRTEKKKKTEDEEAIEEGECEFIALKMFLKHENCLSTI